VRVTCLHHAPADRTGHLVGHTAIHRDGLLVGQAIPESGQLLSECPVLADRPFEGSGQPVYPGLIVQLGLRGFQSGQRRRVGVPPAAHEPD
jgi:hypothetical protein